MHRLCRRFKYGIAHSQFADATIEPAAGRGSDLEPEVSLLTAQGQFQDSHALLDGWAKPENSLDPLGQDSLAMDRTEPSKVKQARIAP